MKKLLTTKRNMAILFITLLAFLFLCTSCVAENQEISDETTPETAAPTEPSTENAPTEKPTEAPTEKPTEKPVVYEEIKDDIREQYFKKFGGQMMNAKSDDALTVQNLGQFGDSIAIHVLEDEKWHWLLWYSLFSKTIEGCEFRFEEIRQVYIYNDAQFFTLEYALEHAYIKAEDIPFIHEEFKRQNPVFYKNPVSEELISIQGSLVPSMISIAIQPQYNDKDYTEEDFSEIPVITYFADRGKLNDLSQIYPRYWIGLDDNITMDEAVAICRILEQRDDIYAIWFPAGNVD